VKLHDQRDENETQKEYQLFLQAVAQFYPFDLDSQMLFDVAEQVFELILLPHASM
jgi:hypothetical protein